MEIKVDTLRGCIQYVQHKNHSIFRNWVWVKQGKLARSSAPYYREVGTPYDKSQRVCPIVVDYLNQNKINMVVSLNYYKLLKDQEALLKDSGIDYHHLKVEDFQPPTKIGLIETEYKMRNKISLVWCGWGQGRTGTMVTAWQILTGDLDKETAIDESTAENELQKKVLESLWEAKLAFFIDDLRLAVRKYEKSNKGGMSMFGMRKSSVASKNIVITLNAIFDFLGIKADLPIDAPTCCEKAILRGWNYSHFRRFIEWAVGPSNMLYVGHFKDATIYGFPAVFNSGVAGATLKALLISAMKNFDKRP